MTAPFDRTAAIARVGFILPGLTDEGLACLLARADLLAKMHPRDLTQATLAAEQRAREAAMPDDGDDCPPSCTRPGPHRHTPATGAAVRAWETAQRVPVTVGPREPSPARAVTPGKVEAAPCPLCGGAGRPGGWPCGACGRC